MVGGKERDNQSRKNGERNRVRGQEEGMVT